MTSVTGVHPSFKMEKMKWSCTASSAQRPLVGGTAVVADHHGVALGVRVGRGDGSDQPRRERGDDQAHRHAHEERESLLAGTTGSLVGGW